MSKKALCIGINDYPGTANDLSGCINDANDWAQELLKRGFAVDKLLDAAATKASITGKITCLLQESHNNDLLVITFSGHGTKVMDQDGDEDDGQDEAICPYDVMSNGPLFDDDIHTLFSGHIESKKIVFIADSCHSGSIIRGPATDFDTSRTIRFLPYQTWINSVPYSSRTPKVKQIRNLAASPLNVDLLLAGCRDSEYSLDVKFDGRPNGLFTYHALKILNNTKPETYEVWFQRIDTIFNSLNYGQHPQLSGTDLAKRYKIFEEGEPKTPVAPHIININIK